MRIDNLTVRNFKKFSEETFTLHPEFTLLIGENGSGKTSILDALAVSLGIWLVEVPDSTLVNSRRNILPTEIRLEPTGIGDRIQFREKKPVQVEATGLLAEGQSMTWVREIKADGSRTSNQKAKGALKTIRKIFLRDEAGEAILCPVLVYYGAGRAWLPSSKRLANGSGSSSGPARRWGAFYDCFNERIRFEELRKWFLRETTAAGSRGGSHRPGFEVVKRAVLGCIPKSDGLWFDADREQIVLSIAGNAQPFDNLSAGQRMMLALVADIAIKAVTQNAFLLPFDKLGGEDEPLPKLLRETPGVVLIDEIDVHLHPKWQRHVIEDLRRTFPRIQFIGTTHSPFLVQSLRSGEELIRLDGLPPAEVFDKSIGDISKEVMGVPHTEVSDRYGKMKQVARTYLETLDKAAMAPEEKLKQYEEELSKSIAPYADNPAFQAFLELKRAAKLGK